MKAKRMITAKFSSVCPECGGRIKIGDSIYWAPGEKASHVHCGAGDEGSAHAPRKPSRRRSSSRPRRRPTPPRPPIEKVEPWMATIVQEDDPFTPGEVLSVALWNATIQAMETAQGLKAIEYPGEVKHGQRLVVVMVVEAGHEPFDTNDMMDPWTPHYDAKVRLATEQEAARLMQAAAPELARREAEKKFRAAFRLAPDWRQQIETKRIAYEPGTGLTADLYLDPDGRVFHARPTGDEIYCNSTTHEVCLPLEEVLALVRTMGWRIPT